MYCVTSPRKDSRYREPPPTPPGYLGISLADLKEGPHPHLKPPDYNVAVRRSKMMQSGLSRPPPAPVASRPGACTPAKTVGQPQRQQPQPPPAAVAVLTDADSEADGMLPLSWLLHELLHIVNGLLSGTLWSEVFPSMPWTSLLVSMCLALFC